MSPARRRNPRRRTRCGVALVGAVASLAAAGAALGQPSSAQDFANAAGSSDAYEIAASQLMLTQSGDPQVRRFAQQMIDDHRRTSADLSAAAQASGLKPPAPIVGGDMAKMLSALQSQKGADLDRSYWSQQVNAHTAALVTEQDFLARGSDPNLRRAAQAAVPLIQQHLQMARRLGGG